MGKGEGKGAVGGMDLEGLQAMGTKEQGEKGTAVYSITQILLGAVMVWQGAKSRPHECPEIPEDEVEAALAKLSEGCCPNGAAEYLFVAGILILVLNLIGLMLTMARRCAEKDGKVTCGEQCGLNFLGMISGCLFVVDFALMIWGSVVVFGAYASWQYAPETRPLPPAINENFCDYDAFITAFVILIVRWVMIPLGICTGCMKMCCKKGDSA